MNREFSAYPARQRDITLSDGRSLAVAEFGPEDGRPVVFIAGAASSRSMNAFGPAASNRRVRMITFDRPGLGGSSYDPNKTLRSVARDLHFALSALDVKRPCAVANSQGAPFALMAASVGVFSRTALVSPADEIAHPATRKLLSVEVNQFVERIAKDHAGMKAHLSSFDADGMVRFVLSGASESDAAVFSDPQFQGLFRRSVEEGLSRGGCGYAQDTILASSPWDVAVPTAGSLDVWFGADDASHSPDLGRNLTERFGGERRVIEGVGSALLWTHTGLILDSLLG